MIVIIEREKFDGRVGEVFYEIIDQPNVIGCRYLLKNEQIENLKTTGSTILSSKIYKALGDERVKKEIKELIGIDVNISEVGPMIVLRREKPYVFTSKKESKGEYYILLLNNEELYRVAHLNNTLDSFIEICKSIFDIADNEYEIVNI